MSGYEDYPGYRPGYCLDCGKSWEDHQPAIVAQKRADDDVAVAQLVEEKVYFHRLVEYKMAQGQGDTSVPRPRDPNGDLDRLEIAREKAWQTAKSYQALMARKMQDLKAARGNAEYIQVPKGAINRRAYFASKDAPLEGFETRDAFS